MGKNSMKVVSDGIVARGDSLETDSASSMTVSRLNSWLHGETP